MFVLILSRREIDGIFTAILINLFAININAEKCSVFKKHKNLT